MPTIEAIRFGSAEGNEVTVTLRGEPENIIGVLVSGLPMDALEQIRDAMQAELVKRNSSGGHTSTCAKWVHVGPSGELFGSPLWAPYATCTCGYDEAQSAAK